MKNIEKKVELIIVLSLIVWGIVYFYKDNTYVEYRPHYLSGNNEVKFYGKSKLSPVEFKNTKFVLEYYREKYKTENDNVILITKRLSEDWRLLWKYTCIANDSIWRKSLK